MHGVRRTADVEMFQRRAPSLKLWRKRQNGESEDEMVKGSMGYDTRIFHR